MTSNWYYDCSR